MTPTARLVAAARALADYVKPCRPGCMPGEDYEQLLAFAVVRKVIAAAEALDTPPAAAPTAEPTDEELLAAFQPDDVDEPCPEEMRETVLASLRRVVRLGVERERARVHPVTTDEEMAAAYDAAEQAGSCLPHTDGLRRVESLVRRSERARCVAKLRARAQSRRDFGDLVEAAALTVAADALEDDHG